MTSDAVAFSRIGKDGTVAEMRRSGRAWKTLVEKIREYISYRPAAARAIASGMKRKADGILGTTHALEAFSK